MIVFARTAERHTIQVRRRIWWATWPGALALGALSLVLVGMTAVPLLLVAVLPPADVSGTDLAVAVGPAVGRRIVYGILGVACLAVPVAVVVVARKMWLGWLLVLLLASAVILGVVLWTADII